MSRFSVRPQRYGDIAVLLHWLIAILIIALLAIGKFMTGLDENSGLRFVLTQWHKTFGILVLALAIIRLVWRLTHQVPALPDTLPAIQQLAANGAHVVLYVLMFALPVSGWILVSASPLNVPTLLFNLVELPHLPMVAANVNKAELAEAFHDYHEWGGNLLLLVLLAHVGAALKHHFVDRDDVLRRMAPDMASPSFRAALRRLIVLVAVAAGALALYANTRPSVMLGAGSSNVSFMASVTGADTPGLFAESTVTINYDAANPAATTLSATVQTGSFQTDNPQVSSSLAQADWFDVANHPTARFESTRVEPVSSNELKVVGTLTLKATTLPVEFLMTLTPSDDGTSQVASGRFPINRLDYGIGASSQPGDDSVGLTVEIGFSFEMLASP